MFATMLVPLDGSEVAESILPTVEAFARLTGATVTLFQAVEPLEQGWQGVEPATSDLDHDRRAGEHAHAYLVGVAQRLSHHGLSVHTRVLLGRPAEEIIALAREYDLVAMATHGRSGIGRWVYGSVADKVLQGAITPILLIRARPDHPASAAAPRRLVVPLDGSELAEVALPLAAEVVRRAGGTIVVTQSLFWAQMAVGDYPYGYGAGLASPGLIEEAETSVREYLTSIGQRLADAGVRAEVDLRYTPAADAILTCAEEQQADLIVMSTHGRGGLGRWMLGSVADRVLRGATLPVLLVRAEASPAGSPTETAHEAGAPGA